MHRGHGAHRLVSPVNSLVNRLLYFFRDGDDPASRILKREFAHAVEQFLDRHRNFRFAFLECGQDFLDALHFSAQR